MDKLQLLHEKRSRAPVATHRIARQCCRRRHRGKIGVGAWIFNWLAVVIVVLVPLPAGADSGKTVRIVVLGDSLTAGYGLRPSEAFPVKLEKELRRRGRNVRLINAGVSGDTTAAGLARLNWAVPKGTDAVIVELGANDALRGLSPSKARVNLDKILTRLKKRGIELMVAGMLAPLSMGDAYTKPFNRIFTTLAKKYDAVLYPFFLEGVAMHPALNQNDGIHPNKKGVAVIVKNITPKVEELIKRVAARRLARSGG